MALAAPSGRQDSPADGFRHQPSGYDDLVSALDEALDAIARDDVEARCAAIDTASDIVTSLFLGLDIGRQGAIGESIGPLYGAILGRLLQINLHNDPASAREVIRLLEPLRGVSRRQDRSTIGAPSTATQPR